MRKDFIKFILLAAIAIGAGPASAAFWQWSKTASNNSGADPSINWAEGMSPSSVNDSARAMMARAAEYRDDISGLLVTGGSSTAYTVTTNQTLCQAPDSTTTPKDGQLLSLTMHVTSAVTPSITADGCNAFAILSAPGQAVASGTLISGSPYSFKFSTSNNGWMLRGFYASSTNVPLGALVPYTGTTVPNSNFVFPAGQCVSTTTYASYWAMLGSPPSGSCTGGNFQLIDLSGSIPAGLDTMPGFSAANRLTSSANGCGTAMTSIGARCANGNQSRTLSVTNLPSFTPAGTISNGAITINNGTGTADVSIGSGTVGGGGAFGQNAHGAITASQGTSTFTGTAVGSSTPFPSMPPVVGVTYLLRVL